jgi:hypothetical protein
MDQVQEKTIDDSAEDSLASSQNSNEIFKTFQEISLLLLFIAIGDQKC